MLYLFEDYVFDTDQRELRRGPRLISLQPQVFDLLEYLIRNRERVVTKDDLFGAVWGRRIVSESALTTPINAARTAIGVHCACITTRCTPASTWPRPA